MTLAFALRWPTQITHPTAGTLSVPVTPEDDLIARDIAEKVFAAYANQANTRIHPGAEQTLLARLAEALRPLMGSSAETLVEVANSVLGDFELITSEVRGPRIASLNLTDQSVSTRL